MRRWAGCTLAPLAFLALATTADAGPARLPTAPPVAPAALTPARLRVPWLGVEMATAPGGQGVQISHAVRGAPAALAGLKDGDVVTKIGGARAASPAEVTRLVVARAVGDAVEIMVLRGGTELTVNATLTSRPSADEMLRMEFVGTFAPAWSALAAASGGVPPSIQALRGRVVVIEFWATWCGPCRTTMPLLDAWQAKYGAQGLSVVGITTEALDVAALFAQQAGIRYALASDPSGATTRAYAVRSIPAVFVIDKRGVVRETSLGDEPGSQIQIERLVQALLAEPTGL